jgi:hypothetical protein
MSATRIAKTVAAIVFVICAVYLGLIRFGFADRDNAPVWIQPLVNLVFGPSRESVSEFDPLAPRVWRSTADTSITAALVRFNAGFVTLRHEDGRELTVKRSDLSKSDRKFLNGLSDSRANAIAESKPRIKMSLASKPVPNSRHRKGMITLQNSEAYPIENIRLFWAWVERGSQKFSTFSKRMSFDDLRRSLISTGSTTFDMRPHESLVVTTPAVEAEGQGEFAVDDALLAQVFVDGHLVSHRSNDYDLNSLASRSDLQDEKTEIELHSETKITTPDGKPRRSVKK